MDSLAAAFDASVARHPDRIALIDANGGRTSFRDLQVRADAFAARCVARGLGPGDRALVAMPVSSDLYAVLCGLWRIGAVAVFPEPAMGLGGLRHAARTTRPAAFVAASWYRALGWVVPELVGLPILSPGGKPVRPARIGPADRNAPALISFTSGTTGAPKAIVRSHALLMAQYQALAPILDGPPDARDLVGFPVVALVNLGEGRTSVLPDWPMRRPHRVDGRDLSASIARRAVTRALLPPALCEVLAEAGTPAALDTIFTGGGPVFPDVIESLAAGGRRVVSVYGSTEAEPIAWLDAAEITAADHEAMRGGAGLLAGRPVPGIDLRLVAGEIQVAGRHVNKGYLDPARDVETKVREAGRIWHRTGDAGRLDAGDRLWLLGRIGTAVGQGEGAMHPFAVEASVRFWPGVRAAALARLGGAPVLAIVGDDACLTDWRVRTRSLGIDDVRPLPRLPMDRRHASKVDARRLCRMLGGGHS